MSLVEYPGNHLHIWVCPHDHPLLQQWRGPLHDHLLLQQWRGEMEPFAFRPPIDLSRLRVRCWQLLSTCFFDDATSAFVAASFSALVAISRVIVFRAKAAAMLRESMRGRRVIHKVFIKVKSSSVLTWLDCKLCGAAHQASTHHRSGSNYMCTSRFDYVIPR